MAVQKKKTIVKKSAPKPASKTVRNKPAPKPKKAASSAKGSRLFITGVSGYFASRLLPLLEKDPSIAKIVGIDIKPPAGSFSKLEFHQVDVRDSQVPSLMRGCDTVLHMAFILLRLPGQREVDSINIDGSKAVLEAALDNKVKKIIFTSSVVGYGMHPDNPVPLKEDMPLRPNEKLFYSRAKAEVEKKLSEIEAAHPEIVITRLRPSTIAGPTASDDRMASLTGVQGVIIKGFNPAIQLTHEDDLASALHLALQKNLRGAFNAVSDGAKTLPELYAIRGAKTMVVAESVGRFLMWFMWVTRKTIFAAEWIGLSMYSLVADNAKLKKQGWKPKYTTVDTFREVLKAHNIEPLG